jgi:hypothetical protein
LAAGSFAVPQPLLASRPLRWLFGVTKLRGQIKESNQGEGFD